MVGSDAVTEIPCNLLVSHSEVILSKISEIMLHHVRIVSENIMQCFDVTLTLKASLAPSLAPVGHPISLASFSERRRD